MFSFVRNLTVGPETHPEAKTFADYYDDLAAAIKEAKALPDAKQDSGFTKAAAVLEAVIKLCHDIEKIEPTDAKELNAERSRMLKTLGKDGLIDVKGEASRLLAVRYRETLIKMLNKEYWPSEDCPSIMGQSVLSVYADNFEKRTDHMKSAIIKYQERIDAYDQSKQARPRPGM